MHKKSWLVITIGLAMGHAACSKTVSAPAPSYCAIGKAPPSILASNQMVPREIAVWHDTLYWTTSVTQPQKSPTSMSIVSMPKAGGAPTTLVKEDGHFFTALAPTDSGLYFLESWALKPTHPTNNPPKVMGSIRKLPHGAKTPIDVAADLSSPSSAMLVDEASIYFSDSQGLKKVPLAGGEAVVLSPDGGERLAQDATHLYVVTSGEQRVRSIPKAGGPAVVIKKAQGGGQFDIAVDGAWVFYTAGRDVEAFPLAGGTAFRQSGGGGGGPIVAGGGIVYFVSNNSLSWTKVSASNRNDFQNCFAESSGPSSGPSSLALDSDWLYFTTGSGTVGRRSLH